MTAIKSTIRLRRWYPWHRRTLDETCMTCGSLQGIWCVDIRFSRMHDVHTKNLHRYRPFTRR